MGTNGNGKNGSYTAGQFIDAIPGSGGIISTIAKRVGCAWHTAKKYIDGYATVKQAYDDECEKLTDAAESTVIKAIMDNDLGAAKWYLTMKAKDRGYAKKQEVDVTSGGERIESQPSIGSLAEALEAAGFKAPNCPGGCDCGK